MGQVMPGGLWLIQAIELDTVNFDVNLVTVVNDLASITALDDPDDL
ncbi:hypothetical protein [uncultured Erythrobacter sp.]|nr:hypothetical protein [uncultured Erythrobacter sp.]